MKWKSELFRTARAFFKQQYPTGVPSPVEGQHRRLGFIFRRESLEVVAHVDEETAEGTGHQETAVEHVL